MEKAEKNSLCGSVKAVVFIVVHIVDRVGYNVSVADNCSHQYYTPDFIPSTIMFMFQSHRKFCAQIVLFQNNLIGFIGLEGVRL